MKRIEIVAVVIGALVIGLVLLVQGKTDTPKQPQPAPAPIQWIEPYGGCKEAARYPDSVGYAECVEHGLLP